MKKTQWKKWLWVGIRVVAEGWEDPQSHDRTVIERVSKEGKTWKEIKKYKRRVRWKHFINPQFSS